MEHNNQPQEVNGHAVPAPVIEAVAGQLEPQAPREKKQRRPRATAVTTHSPEVAALALEIEEHEIPTVGAMPDMAEMERIEGIAKLIGVTLTVNPMMHYDAAAKAVEVAHKYRDDIRALKKGICNVKVQPTAGVVAMDWHDRLATDAKLGRTIAVRGPAGNGKSLGVRTALEAMGFNVYHLDCTDSTTAEMLVGGLMPQSNGGGGIDMVFRDGVITRAFADAKGAIQLDEFDALDPRVAMVLQSALHRAAPGKTRFVSCPDHEEGGMEAKGLCPIVVTMNTWGSGATRDYVGRNALDAASMDRFDTVIDTTYAKEELILSGTGLDKGTARELVKKVQKVRKDIENKNLRIVLSTRRLLDVSESIRILGLSLEEAFSRDFTERLEPMDRDALGLKIEEPKVDAKPATSSEAVGSLLSIFEMETHAAFFKGDVDGGYMRRMKEGARLRYTEKDIVDALASGISIVEMVHRVADAEGFGIDPAWLGANPRGEYPF